MKWFYLFLAGAVEITWAVAMKKSNGFTVLIPSIITGVGIVGTTLLGIFLFNEKLSVPQVVCVILIVIGITGLKILGKE